MNGHGKRSWYLITNKKVILISSPPPKVSNSKFHFVKSKIQFSLFNDTGGGGSEFQYCFKTIVYPTIRPIRTNENFWQLPIETPAPKQIYGKDISALIESVHFLTILLWKFYEHEKAPRAVFALWTKALFIIVFNQICFQDIITMKSKIFLVVLSKTTEGGTMKPNTIEILDRV